MYQIILRDYKTGKLQVIIQSKSLRNIQEEIELLAFDYIIEKSGREFCKIYNKSKSGKFGKFPTGFFICKSNKNFIKLNIYEKKNILGIFYNGFVINKILSFQICKIEDEEDELIEYFGNLNDKKKLFSEIHSELIKRFELKNDKAIL